MIILNAMKSDGIYKFNVRVNGMEIGVSKAVIKDDSLRLEWGMERLSERENHLKVLKQIEEKKKMHIEIKYKKDGTEHICTCWALPQTVDHWDYGFIGMIRVNFSIEEQVV